MILSRIHEVIEVCPDYLHFYYIFFISYQYGFRRRAFRKNHQFLISLVIGTLSAVFWISVMMSQRDSITSQVYSLWLPFANLIGLFGPNYDDYKLATEISTEIKFNNIIENVHRISSLDIVSFYYLFSGVY